MQTPLINVSQRSSLISPLVHLASCSESVCFTIVVGLSSDFVLHFSHAYCEPIGSTDRSTRTKHALINLGPSMLAAGVTTLAGAAIMLFTEIYFWKLFAFVLFFTIIQAMIGSFVVFLVLADCIGPSNPTFLVDWTVSKYAKHCKQKEPAPKVKSGSKELPSGSRPVDVEELNFQPCIDK
jgi:hypothetical protein